MIIDPTAPLGNAIHSLKTQQHSSVESLARVLNLKVGDTINGAVIQATPVTPATRQTLLQAYLQQSSGTTTTNGAQPSPPAETQALLQSAKLQLVKLQVGAQQLLTYTDIPVKPQQQVQVLLKTINTLTLLAPNSAASASNSTQGQVQLPSQTGNASAVLKQALRSVLPNHAPLHHLEQGRQLSDSLQASLLLNQLTQKLGSYSVQTLIPKTLQQALQTVANHLRTPAQLSQPPTLKQALQNSGVQLESRLKQVSQASTANAADAKPASTAPLLPRQDLKAALLQLLQRTQSLAQSAAAEGTRGNAAAQQHTGNSSNTLITLLKTLLQGTPQLVQVKQEIPRKALIQQLQHLVQQALNKIQYQQLQSLSRRAAVAEGTPGVNHWQLELPLRFGAEVQPLHLQFNEQWLHHRDEREQSAPSSDEEPRKQRKWLVRLSIELPDAGFFHAQLQVINDSVNASLWAEDPTTLKKAQSQLNALHQRLTKAGIDVQSLDCFEGKPNQQDNRLSYSLVDIKT